jgi:hypothetical protein
MPKPRDYLIALALLAGGAGAFALQRLRDATAPEVVELMRTGSEKVLRAPMRPARGGERVLLVALDGVGDGALRDAIRAGRMPHLAAVLGAPTDHPDRFAHGYAAPGVLSILPSTTFAAWSSVFTGEPAGVTGVPGNEWWDRAQGRFYAPAPVTVAGVRHALEVYTDQLMSGVVRAPTVYERAGVRSYVSLSSVQRGADLVTVPDPTALGDVVSAMVRGFGEEGKVVGREAYAELDRAAVRSLLATLDRHGLADLQTVYFPGVDLYTHAADPALEEQQRYLAEVVDPELGRLLDAYRRHGALADTWVVVVADHGHTPVLADDRHALEAEGDDEPPEVLRRAGFRVRGLHVEPERVADDFQAVVAYQGAIAYVYLADRTRCPEPGQRCDWRRAPARRDVLAVAEAFRAASATGAGVPALRGTLDLVLAREPRPVGRPPAPFQVWDGRRLRPVGEWLRAHPRPDLLELERRLRELATGPRGHNAGDVLLLARTGTERPIAERFYFSGLYHSWHGSPAAQDSRIPLLVARAGMPGAAVRERVHRAVGARPDQLGITPLVLDLLGRRAPGAD